MLYANSQCYYTKRVGIVNRIVDPKARAENKKILQAGFLT